MGIVNKLDLFSMQIDSEKLYSQVVDNFDQMKNSYDMVPCFLQFLWTGTEIESQVEDILYRYFPFKQYTGLDNLVQRWELIDNYFEDVCTDIDEEIQIVDIDPYMHWFYTAINDEGIYSLFLGISKKVEEEVN